MAAVQRATSPAAKCRPLQAELGNEVKIPNVVDWLWDRNTVGTQRLLSFQEDRTNDVEIDAGFSFQHDEFPHLYEPEKADLRNIRTVGDHH